MSLRAVVRSGWFAYGGLMGGAGLFERFTSPWTSSAIPNPYVMFYGVGTTLMALRGYGWGLLTSLSWWLTRHYYWVWTQTPEYRWEPDQGIRLALHILWPLFISRLAWKAREAERQKDELLMVLRTGITHEFNNLLMVIMGNCHLLMAEMSEGSPEYAKLQEVLAATEQAASLVESIRRHAKEGRVSGELKSTAHAIQRIVGV